MGMNELVIERGTGVKHDQRKQKPRSDAVWSPGRIFPKVRQQGAFSAKDHWRSAAECHHPDATRDHSLGRAFLPARGAGNRTFDAAMALQAPWVNNLSEGFSIKDIETVHRVVTALRKKLESDDEREEQVIDRESCAALRQGGLSAAVQRTRGGKPALQS
jgi:hypothetical protein